MFVYLFGIASAFYACETDDCFEKKLSHPKLARTNSVANAKLIDKGIIQLAYALAHPTITCLNGEFN